MEEKAVRGRLYRRFSSILHRCRMRGAREDTWSCVWGLAGSRRVTPAFRPVKTRQDKEKLPEPKLTRGRHPDQIGFPDPRRMGIGGRGVAGRAHYSDGFLLAS